MKNKKLLTRLFALLASLVLVLALALPCFADNSGIDVRESFSDYVPVMISEFDDVFSLPLEVDVRYFALLYNEYDGSTTVGYIVHTVSSTSDGSYYSYSGNGFYSDFAIFNVLTIGSTQVSGYSYTYQYFDGNSESARAPLDDVGEFNLLIFVPSDMVDNQVSPTLPSSDMYSNLFNILKDAVYGSDAELTGSQEYALTLISTILTYATILLPVILVIFIAVWCFKRF